MKGTFLNISFQFINTLMLFEPDHTFNTSHLQKQNMDMDDDDDNLFDDFDVENDDMLRLLESGENQYRSSQMPQEDLPMPTLNQELQMSAIEEPNVVDLATTANAGYNPHGMQVIEDDLNFDLQRQGYSSYSNTRANENIMNELINLKKEDKVKDHKIESLKLEIIKWKNLSRREDTPMRDISDTKSQIDSKIFPNTNGFSVKRIDYEGRSTSSRYNRPIKKLMSTHKVIPAPIQRQPSLMSSQRTDVSMQSTPAPVTIDHKKIERQNKLLAILLGDSFLKWRRNTHIQIGTDLTQTHLNELCQLEAKKLLPTKTCNPDSHRRLTLVHNDYIDSLSNYDCDGILQKLLNIFRLSLSIALKENQNTIIVYIVSKIKLLVETFAETVDILYNEFNRMDTTSTLFFVGMSLSLFYADVNPAVSKNLKYHLPDLSQLTLMELTTITNDYSIKPDIISKVVKERIKPEAAKNGVLSILQIIITISKKVRQSFKSFYNRTVTRISPYPCVVFYWVKINVDPNLIIEIILNV
ncbi:hypothetical protein K501DRAFT_338674 [Backusella circina FSU 941]|nr:hypothetical protein K501DRAFT_338674 [Backusella circina FSU 941]